MLVTGVVATSVALFQLVLPVVVTAFQIHLVTILLGATTMEELVGSNSLVPPVYRQSEQQVQMFVVGSMQELEEGLLSAGQSQDRLLGPKVVIGVVVTLVVLRLRDLVVVLLAKALPVVIILLGPTTMEELVG